MELEATARVLAPGLLAYAFARTGCRSTAEDVAQDALVALVQCWHRGGPPDSPEAFVFAIAKRRAAGATARRALLAPLDGILARAHTDLGADIVYERRAELESVLRALRRLPRRDREVLLLSAAGELQTAEVATVTGATPAAVKMRLHRARRRLAELLPGSTHGRP